MKLKSWVTKKAERRVHGIISGNSLFAIALIAEDELVAVKAGKLVDENYLRKHASLVRGAQLQVADDLFLAPTTETEWNDTLVGVNHSCQPNVYVCGDICVRALRAIKPGEEITLDYALAYATDTQAFTCKCKTSSCRGQIRADDWRSPDLQAKYKGKFTNYIQSLIDSEAT